MRLVFVHGWSVTHTNTYGDLPAGLAEGAGDFGIDLQIDHIQLGKYISFHDEVTLDDIARAFDAALRDLPGNGDAIQPFSAITHSTGGPVVRHWLERFYGARDLASSPLSHAVMLAPANHGSSLAVLGKKRVGRIKAWFSGVEPGQRVLDWLSLGSVGQWELNRRFLDYKSPAGKGFFPFVLTGQGIDTALYDFLNSYLVESGSDGVVRVAGANINHRFITLEQTDEIYERGEEPRQVFALQSSTARPIRRSPTVALGVFSSLSHSGRNMGIMNLRRRSQDFPRVVEEILRCLVVEGPDDYRRRVKELRDLTGDEQTKTPVGKKDPIGRYSMMVFRVVDQNGEVIDDENYDIFLLGGSEYAKHALPSGFFVDRQMNKASNCLVYYVDADKMSEVDEELWGIQVVVRPGPGEGFSYYAPVEFRSNGLDITSAISPNETTYIEIKLRRDVDKNVFRFEPATQKPSSFKNTKPSGEAVDDT
jgi:hypothetical protein